MNTSRSTKKVSRLTNTVKSLFPPLSLSLSLTCDWDGSAERERVAGVLGRAGAHGNVVHHRALGAGAARSRARVHALVAHTVLVARTVVVQDTLGLAGDVRVAIVLLDADADGQAVLVLALGVGATRRRTARVDHHRRSRSGCEA